MQQKFVNNSFQNATEIRQKVIAYDISGNLTAIAYFESLSIKGFGSTIYTPNISYVKIIGDSVMYGQNDSLSEQKIRGKDKYNFGNVLKYNKTDIIPTSTGDFVMDTGNDTL